MEWELSPEEQRVLGSLVEKEATTPDQYPLSVNALRSACNQKSNRDPVMALSEADVRATLTALSRRGLVRDASGYGGRVSKFAHRFGQRAGGLALEPEQVALLAVLMLRGPQTLGELRARSERLHPFADTAAVERVMSGLEQHPDGPLVRALPREPGKRERRYAHCLGPPPAETDAAAAPAEAETGADGDAALEARVAALEEALASMQAQVDRLAQQAGSEPSGD